MWEQNFTKPEGKNEESYRCCQKNRNRPLPAFDDADYSG